MAFLNTPMAEVWKATKRTFSEFVDVDRTVRSEPQPRARNNAEPILNPVNTNSTQELNARPVVYGSEDISRLPIHNTGSDFPSHSRTTQTQVSNTRRPKHNSRSQGNLDSEFQDQTPDKTHTRSRIHVVGHSVTSPTSAGRSFEKLQGSQNVHAGRVKPSTSYQIGNLGLLSHGFSTSKSNKSGTNVASLSQDNTDHSIDYLRHSQTVPELSFGLYPQYSEYQPREPTVRSKEQPSSLPELELSEFERKSRSHGGAINSRASRTLDRNTRPKYRSSSSDRASAMKVIQRRQSFNTSKTTDVHKTSDEDDDEDWLEQAEKVKLKFMSMWNNVKYGWTVKTKTPFNIHKAIWLLGKCYHHRPEDPDLVRLQPGMNAVRSPAMELFKQDFVSRIWLTYRREFPQISGSSLTTDCGWGCMLRSGQMLLAQALIMHFLGRDWTLYKRQTIESERLHRQIIHWFGDQPSDMSPFSLHQLVEIGKRCGKRAGDWFGPSSVAHIIKEAVERAPELNPMLDNICIYVSQDCTVYKQDVIDLCTQRRKRSLKPVFFDVEARTPPKNVSSNSGRGQSTAAPQNVKSEQSTTSRTNRQRNDNASGPNENSYSDDSAMSNGTSIPPTGSKSDISKKMCNADMDGLGEAKVRDELMGEKSVLDDNSFEKMLKRFDSEFDKYSSHNMEDRQRDTIEERGSPGSNAEVAGSEDGTLGSDWERVSHQSTPPVIVGNKPSPPPQGNSISQFSKNDAREVNRENEENVDPSLLRKERAADQQRRIRRSRSSSHGNESDTTVHSNNSHSPTEEYTSDWCAVIILVPVRLGGEEVNGIYIRPLQSLFSMANCLGIIGGKPKHSLYFVGFQDEKLIHLDPHYCQQVVDMREKDFPIWSFHCMSPRKMAMTKMDPSCTIGFYLKTREDFDRFCVEIQQVINPPGNTKDYPMFIVREGRCREWNAQHESAAKSERYLRVRHVNQDGHLVSPVTASEDFVLLD